MANLGSPRYLFLCVFQLLIQMQAKVFCYHYKVGDLDSWGIPTSANPNSYNKWSNTHSFRVGDSLLFLYPPSQDSMIQVTPQGYKECNLKDPILYMNDGNSLFNITQPGEFYFTSGEAGHCEKGQKLHISLAGDGAAISYPPTSLPDTAAGPSYPTVFGSIPTPSTSSPLLVRFSAFLASFMPIFTIWLLV